MQESHFLGLFLVHQEVDGLALIAEFTLRVGDLCTDICQGLLSSSFYMRIIIICQRMGLHTQASLHGEYSHDGRKIP